MGSISFWKKTVSGEQVVDGGGVGGGVTTGKTGSCLQAVNRIDINTTASNRRTSVLFLMQINLIQVKI